MLRMAETALECEVFENLTATDEVQVITRPTLTYQQHEEEIVGRRRTVQFEDQSHTMERPRIDETEVHKLHDQFEERRRAHNYSSEASEEERIVTRPAATYQSHTDQVQPAATYRDKSHMPATYQVQEQYRLNEERVRTHLDHDDEFEERRRGDDYHVDEDKIIERTICRVDESQCEVQRMSSIEGVESIENVPPAINGVSCHNLDILINFTELNLPF